MNLKSLDFVLTKEINNEEILPYEKALLDKRNRLISKKELPLEYIDRLIDKELLIASHNIKNKNK